MLSRRRFLITGSVTAAAGALAPALAAVPKTGDLHDWDVVRQQFDVDPAFIHAGLFYLASHPRPVRAAIEQYRRAIDANPLETVEHSLFGAPERNLTDKTTAVIASYIGGKPEEIALTQNTTTGLTILYAGLPLKSGDEILTTTHDHFVHHEAIRLAAERSGASWRRIALFDSSDTISADEIADRVRKAVRPNTRAFGVTWVHSSTGLKLPLRRIAEALAEVNRNRESPVLLFVDGVHGLGVEDPSIVATGIDAFAAGTHKWIFAPRGTGFVWARPAVWARLRPTAPSFSAFELFQAWGQGKSPTGTPVASWFSPGGFQAYEHYWAVPAAFEFHRAIGSDRIAKRIRELNTQMREGMASMPHVTMYTPRPAEYSAGMVCFDVKGMTQQQVVAKLHEKKILGSTTPYALSYARLAFGVQNTPQEVERALRAVRELA